MMASIWTILETIFRTLHPWAPVIAASIAAGTGAWVAHKFGRIQEGIARQQASTAAAAAATAKSKLKLDLFDRRLTIYKSATDEINKAFSKSYIFNNQEYLSKIQGSQWLLNKQIEKYLSEDIPELLKKVADSHYLERHKSYEIISRPSVTVSMHGSKLNKMLVQIDSMFASYLTLDA